MSWNGHFHRSKVEGTKFELLGQVVDGRLRHLVPCDGLTGISCFATHDACHAGDGVVCSLFVSCTFADVVHPIDVLECVGVELLELLADSFFVELPDNVALEVLYFICLAVPAALAALDELADLAAAAINLAAHRVHVDAVLHREVCAEEVVLVASDAALT